MGSSSGLSSVSIAKQPQLSNLNNNYCEEKDHHNIIYINKFNLIVLHHRSLVFTALIFKETKLCSSSFNPVAFHLK